MTLSPDIFTILFNDIENSKPKMNTYEYLDLSVKLTYLMRIEEQLDAIRLCLIELRRDK